MIKVNANTGACSAGYHSAPGIDFASPVIATPPGGVTTLFVGVQDNGAVQGPMMAINDSTCKVEWQRNPYPRLLRQRGARTPTASTQNGVPLVIFGSGDPDCAVYALNAMTGATLWRVQSLVGGLERLRHGNGHLAARAQRHRRRHGLRSGQGPDPLRDRSDDRRAEVDTSTTAPRPAPITTAAGPRRPWPARRWYSARRSESPRWTR